MWWFSEIKHRNDNENQECDIFHCACPFCSVNCVFGSMSTIDSGSFCSSISNFEAMVTTDWYYEWQWWPHPWSSGNAVVKISNSAASAAGVVARRSDGPPYFSCLEVTASFKTIDIQLSGSISVGFTNFLMVH